jgi:hypothetical protein
MQLSKEQDKLIKKSLKEFDKKLKKIERDSKDAFAITIFINACYDTSSFQDNRFSALCQFLSAREAAECLVKSLTQTDQTLFNKAILEAQDILINSKIVYPDLCYG